MAQGDYFIDHGPEGSMVQVVANVHVPHHGSTNDVGLIAVSGRGRGWVVLSPDDAEELAAALREAAALSRVPAA